MLPHLPSCTGSICHSRAAFNTLPMCQALLQMQPSPRYIHTCGQNPALLVLVWHRQLLSAHVQQLTGLHQGASKHVQHSPTRFSTLQNLDSLVVSCNNQQCVAGKHFQRSMRLLLMLHNADLLIVPCNTQQCVAGKHFCFRKPLFLMLHNADLLVVSCNTKQCVAGKHF